MHVAEGSGIPNIRFVWKDVRLKILKHSTMNLGIVFIIIRGPGNAELVSWHIYFILLFWQKDLIKRNTI